MSSSKDEAVKLQKHLSLLRQEYSKLQQKYVELEHSYGLLSGQTGAGAKDSYASRLVRSAAELFDNNMFSDMTINIGGRVLPGHKIILQARGANSWCKEGNQELSTLGELELTGLNEDVGLALMKWVYTDKINLHQPPAKLQGEQSCVSFSVQLLAGAHRYSLPDLKLHCERFLIGNVDTSNCIALYQTSEEYFAPQLSNHCLEVITTNWDGFSTEDFLPLSATLLYQMFKKRSEYPLHLAIEHRRDDVVFLYLIEFSKVLASCLAQRDLDGVLPLHLALALRNAGIAETLIQHGSNVDQLDSRDNSLLHLAIRAGDLFTANMLISKGSQTDLQSHDKSTVLHLSAAYSLPALSATQLDPVYRKFPSYHKAPSLSPLVTKLLSHGANPNAQDKNGDTPLHIAIKTENYEIIDILLDSPGVDLQCRNSKNETLLWLALTNVNQDDSLNDLMLFEPQENVVANKLVKKGCDVNAMFPETENLLLHVAAQEERETAALFLLHHGAHTSVFNMQGLAPLHIAAGTGLVKLTSALLEKSASPNLRTKAPVSNIEAYEPAVPTQQTQPTPCDVFSDAVSFYLDLLYQKMTPTSPRFKSLPRTSATGSPPLSQKKPTRVPVTPVHESIQATAVSSYNPFGEETDSTIAPIPFDKIVAMGTETDLNPFPDGEEIISKPTELEELNPFGTSPVEEITLITHSPSTPSKHITPPTTDATHLYTESRQEHLLRELTSGRTALHIAIAARQSQVISALMLYHQEHKLAISAQLPLDINVLDDNGDSPLALALWTHQLDVADRLLQAGSDLQGRESTRDTSLLLRAISYENSDASHFLIRSLSLRDSTLLEGDLSLSAAVKHRLPAVVQALVHSGLDVNTPDKRGDPPLWVSLRSKQDDIASLLVSSDGCDCDFWRVDPALGVKYSLLHRSILLRDSHTACYLVRAGASIDAPISLHNTAGGLPQGLETQLQQILCSPMHLSSALGLDEVVQVLFENQANVNSVDELVRSPLHLAIKCKQNICVKLLLAHPALDLSIRDATGNTPFSTALRAKDHSAASAILDRDPHSANSPDSKGRSYIHIAVEEQDIFMLAFLLRVQVDVNSRVLNQLRETALHLAIKTENESVIRHLLDGANVNLVDGLRRAPLHLAVSRNLPHIVEALLDHGASINIQDEMGNNPLHVAMERGCQASASILLGHDSCDIAATNAMGQHYLHVLASNAPKGEVSANIYRCLIEISGRDSIPINALDTEGNTPLLLAFCNGNMQLCEAFIKDGAHPSIPNRKGLSVFTVPTPSTRPLYQVLSMIRREPEWLDGPNCLNQECQTKFSFSVRKHHCRHCGRLLCTKCLSQQMPILKFEINKPVKICAICCELLSKGVGSATHH